MKDFIEKCKDRFYSEYLLYTALESELLFFVVCDAIFLTQVKKLTLEQISEITFLSLIFSLLVQYPLLKFVHRAGNSISLRLGSIVFLLSAICITFAPNYVTVLAGGFLKCIGNTLGAVGPAIMKKHLAGHGSENQFVSYQSDANGFAALVMMASSFFCGPLFAVNAYYPMFACILLCIGGVMVSFRITHNEPFQETALPVSASRQSDDGRQRAGHSFGVLLFSSFAIVTALSGVGLTYSRLNFQELLSGSGSEYVVSLLSIVSTMIYLFRFLSDLAMRKVYYKLGDNTYAIAGALLMAGLMLQVFPWFHSEVDAAGVLFMGYLMQAFVRDPYITLVQNSSLEGGNYRNQQSSLVAQNAAKKVGALLLAGASIIILHEGDILWVMTMMAAASGMNLLLSFMIMGKGREKLQ